MAEVSTAEVLNNEEVTVTENTVSDTGSFVESLPEDLRSDASLSKFSKLDDLAKSYVHLEKS